MKKTFISIYVLGALALFSSCKKWVDVEPNDRVLEDKVFTNPDNIRNSLNGIYSNVAAKSLYGEYMTMTAIDALGQLYSGSILNTGGGPAGVSNGTPALPYANYDYANPTLKEQMLNAWTQAYRTVLNINMFLVNLDKYPNVLDAAEEKLYRGELYGLRAMIQFDMLRVFGPIYLTDSTALSVPYYTTATPNVKPVMPATEVMDSVLTDIDRAIAHLGADPVLTTGKQDKILNDGLDYTRMRNLRMNWYAAKALKARALLYRNAKTAAYEVATELIGKMDGEFPWMNADTAANPIDRTFSREVIFSLNVPNLYDWSRKLYGGDVKSDVMWAPNTTRLNNTYEGKVQTDYRFSTLRNFSWWDVPPGATFGYKTLRKFNNVDGVNVQFRFRMPMLRKSEIYYIAAECAPDDATGFQLLNTVRRARGLTEDPLTTNRQTEIQKEYAKEMYGEGQLFFYYKRTNTARILKASGTGSTGTANLQTMTRTQYVVPLPESESYYQ
ncbi:RagB/SusD family nutrient uptake outer membrane protein [Chitinophaga sp. NPDC101104]|uniref:RagB/SusD family nutrient uptake outer membrane protein n=1 Tax=Chitinophaga sp. NPDC101104 TaxID=3390561 RepID=UPI003D06B159